MILKGFLKLVRGYIAPPLNLMASEGEFQAVRECFALFQKPFPLLSNPPAPQDRRGAGECRGRGGPSGRTNAPCRTCGTERLSKTAIATLSPCFARAGALSSYNTLSFIKALKGRSLRSLAVRLRGAVHGAPSAAASAISVTLSFWVWAPVHGRPAHTS